MIRLLFVTLVLNGNLWQPCLIPCGTDIVEVLLEDDIGWVLIVEKEVRSRRALSYPHTLTQ